MSESTLYGLGKDLKSVCSGSFKNSFSGSMALWDALCKRYIGPHAGVFSHTQELWDLVKRPDIPIELSLCHAFTFDFAYLSLEDADYFAGCCRKTHEFIGAQYPAHSHWSSFGTWIKKIADERKDVIAFGMDGTSVNPTWGNYRPKRNGKQVFDCHAYLHRKRQLITVVDRPREAR